MSDTTLKTKAQTAIERTLDGGQSITQGDMQVSQASLASAHAVLVHEEQRLAKKSGRRPLFRGINLSGMS